MKNGMSCAPRGNLLKLLVAVIFSLVTSCLLIISCGFPVVHEFLFRFWFQDERLPQISGVLRFTLYYLLLRLMETSTLVRLPPLQAPELWETTIPKFRKVEPVLEILVPIRYITSRRLKLVRNLTRLGYVMSALGFCGQIGPILAGVGTFVLEGVSQAFIPDSHRWYVPTWTVLALMLCHCVDKLSVDSFLATHFFGESYPFLTPPPTSLLRTKLGQKIVLVYSMSTLFFGKAHILMHLKIP